MMPNEDRVPAHFSTALYHAFLGIRFFPRAVGWLFIRTFFPKSLERMKKRLSYRSSMGMFPYLGLAAGLFLLGCVVLAILLSPLKEVTIALIVALAGGVAWSIKRTFGAMEARASLIILEELSYGEGRTREQLRTAVMSYSAPFRISASTYSEALQKLVLEGRVEIVAGQYRNPSHGAEPSARADG
jgi:hypothetical protein